MSRQAIGRRIVTGTVAWATGAALLAVLAAWFFGARAGQSVIRQGEHRLRDLVTAVAASISPEEAIFAVRAQPEARFEREVEAQLVTLRQSNPSIRSVFLVAPDSAHGAGIVILAARGDDQAPRAGGVYRPPVGLRIGDAMHAPIVSAAATHGVRIVALAPVRDLDGAAIAVVGAELDGRAIAAAALHRRQATAAVAGLVVLAIASLAAYRARRGLAAMERLRGLSAQIAIYRVGDVLAGAESDAELMRCALDAMASGSGIDSWATYLREPPSDELRLLVHRELSAEQVAALAPDRVRKDARSPVSRAAWQRQAVVDTASGTGVIAIPLLDDGETVAVLQGFLPTGRSIETDDLALIRWMGAQVAVGLKRIRLERRDQMLALFASGTGEILLGLDLAGTVTYANDAAAEALRGEGESAGDGLVGRPLDSFVDFGSREEPFGLVGAFQDGAEFSGEVTFRRSDGTGFPAEIRISPTADRRGMLHALVLVGHDVTERREREGELESRTRELALLNEQLARAVQDLEKARQAQGEFVANTSHELRTPLNAVIGFATLIEQGTYDSDEEAREFASRIRKSAEHLLGLLNDILDLAKVEAGQFQLSVGVSDLRVPVREAVEATAALASSRGLRIEVDLPEAPLEGRIDPIRVRQVFMNLLGNALKYTDQGSVRVRAWRDGATGESRVEFVDTGVGISAEGQQRLFAKFGRADLSFAGRRAGTGLGLVISKALVQEMGGTIVVESEGLGRGTRASVVFPALVEAERALE